MQFAFARMRRLAAAIVSVCAVFQSQAQTTSPQVLDRVTVEGTGKSLTVPTKQSAEAEVRLTPGGASIVDPKTYETGRSATMFDLLRFAPGVYIQPRFGQQEARISIRGSGLQRTFHGRGIMLLQDGVPLNLADGSFDMQAVESLGLQYVEIFRGGNALQYGGTTFGGSINFVSATGYSADTLRLRGEVGSWDYYQAFGQVGGNAGAIDYTASANAYGQDGFRDWSETSSVRFSGNVGYRINNNAETRFYVVALDTDSQLPGTLTKAALNSNPRQANPGNLAGRQRRDFPQYRISNKTTVRFDHGVLEAAAFYSYKDLHHPIFQVLDQLSHDAGLSLRYVNHQPLGGRENRFVIGLLPQWGKVDDDRYQNIGGNSGARTGESEQRSNNVVLYAENTHFMLPQWGLVLGAQAISAKRKLEDKFFADGANNSVDQTYDSILPKAGVLYRFAPQIDVFANYSRSFEPPTFGELAGGPTVTPVRAQRGDTFELGTRGTLAAAQWNVAYYYSTLKDELLSLNSPTGQPLGTVNAPKTLHQGIEMGLVLTPVPQIAWRNSYLWNDFKFRDNASFGDNRLPGIPRQLLTSELLWQPAGGWYAGPTVEWSPQRYPIDMANTLFADSYAVFGLKAGRQMPNGLSFYVEGRNLGNKKYAATTGVIANANGADQAQFWPGDGRSVYLGLEWRM